MEGTDECPICMMYYKGGLNISNCCGQSICTGKKKKKKKNFLFSIFKKDCFLQIKKPKTQPKPNCPFCIHKDYNIMYKGEKSNEQRNKELIEEQKVIEAQIRVQEEQRKSQIEREKKIKEERMSNNQQQQYSSPESLIDITIKEPEIVIPDETLFEQINRERIERNERINAEKELEKRRLEERRRIELEIQQHEQMRQVVEQQLQELQIQEEEQINSQEQIKKLKDFVPENIFNDLSTNSNVDYDTMMLNEAIRLSELQEKNKNEYSNILIDTSDIDLNDIENNLNSTTSLNENQFISKINENIKIEELTEEEQIELAISLSMKE